MLTGPDGIFMVDPQYAQITDKVVAAIRKISPEPIRFLVNTHVHGDHTGPSSGRDLRHGRSSEASPER